MLSSPVYELPIADDELLLVGRITLMWSQLDFQIDGILAALHRLDGEQLAAFFGRIMIGGKVQAIKKAVHRAPSGSAQQALSAMCESINGCLEDRNLLTHGMWGWNWDEENVRWEPAATSHLIRTTFSASELPDLHERIVEAAVRTDRAYYLTVHREEPSTTRNRAYTSAPFQPGTPPGGMPPRIVR